MAYDSTKSYHDALGRAAQAYAARAKADTQREARDNPYYKTFEAIEPVADLADIGLSLGGLPPVAGAAARGLKGIAGGLAGVEGESVGGATSDLANVGASFMKWREHRDKKAQQDATMKRFEELLKRYDSPSEGTSLEEVMGNLD